MNTENEIQLLSNVQKLLTENPDANQRDMAESVDMSLGMTNALLKRFVQKGWIIMNRISTRTIRYALTPDGMNEIAHRSYRFIKQTMKYMYDYKDIITRLICDAKKKGFTNIVLIGSSEAQFLIEYAAQTLSIPLTVISESDFESLQQKHIVCNYSSDTLLLFSENELFTSPCLEYVEIKKQFINLLDILVS